LSPGSSHVQIAPVEPPLLELLLVLPPLEAPAPLELPPLLEPPDAEPVVEPEEAPVVEPPLGAPVVEVRVVPPPVVPALTPASAWQMSSSSQIIDAGQPWTWQSSSCSAQPETAETNPIRAARLTT
jgi:hypothetical protein